MKNCSLTLQTGRTVDIDGRQAKDRIDVQESCEACTMRLGMMQPYFFPYIGYFSLIHATDQWVVFDTAQYMRRAWVNRNRVLCCGTEPWKYVRVPIQNAARNTSIRDIRIDNDQLWVNDLIAQLDAYRLARAPNYQAVVDWLWSTLSEAVRMSETGRISELLVHLLESTCYYIDLPFRHQVFSQMQLSLPEETGPGEWALQVAKSLNAAAYINPPGGRDLFDPQAFADAGIQLQILEPNLLEYSQGRPDFIAGLSIIDALMWNSPHQTRLLIEQYSLDTI